MKILVTKTIGFCNGVNNAVRKVSDALEKNDYIYSLGEIVHNEIVMHELINKGLVVKNDINEIPDNVKVIFRAHGEKEIIYDTAKKKNLDILDLTCGKVKIIHNKILKEKDSAYIIIIGKKNHPETIAHVSYYNRGCVIETSYDINTFLDDFKRSDLKKIYIVAQTTFSENTFEKIVTIIKEKCKDIEVTIDKTICNATKIRQDEVRELAQKVNKMVIIGGKNSSNTKELANVSYEFCKNVYLIQNVDDLKEISFDKKDIIGVCSGASTPIEMVNEVIDYLNAI